MASVSDSGGITFATQLANPGLILFGMLGTLVLSQTFGRDKFVAAVDEVTCIWSLVVVWDKKNYHNRGKRQGLTD